MGNECTTYSFAELLSNIVDNRGKTCPVDEVGLPLIATNCVKNDTLFPVFEKVRYVNQETYNTWFRGHPKPGDMVFVCKGSPGNVCWTPDPVDFCIAQDMVAIRADSNIVDSKFLFALLRAQTTKIKILNMHVGTMIPHFKKGDFKNLFFDIPNDKGVQKSIGDIYFSFSEKIELNRQMNETLEAMAQALFKSWFVDFDPVIDNALAAGNEIPDALKAKAATRQALGDARKPLPEAIRQQFPSSFAYRKEMGWLPEGWDTQPVYNIANFINGAAFKSTHFTISPDALPVIKIAEIKNGISGQTKLTDKQFDGKYLVNNGEILFSWSGNPDTSINTFVWCGDQGWLNQHIFKVLLHSDEDRTFVYYLLRQLKPVFTEIARDKQTTGLGHVTVKDMKRLYVPKPDKFVLQSFQKYSESVLEKWYKNLLSSKEITKLRDTLLPKLLSGELRIPDAEKLIDDTFRKTEGAANG